ncbi:MAG: DUF3619 family protein [Sideroxydans sp.]|nr:DUF3619 family protein [Sideroxydans sp.]
MNQQLNPEQIRQLLNRSAAQLDDPTLARLREMRTQTLERHTARHAHALALSGHGKHAPWHTVLQQHKPSLWIAGVLLAASILSGIAYWQQTSDNDTSDEDIAILTDDLPIQVYVD